jgi:flagellar motor component MotA
MEPNVQVALIGVVTTFITTMGVVAAALIANYQRRATVAEKVVDEVVVDDDELDTEDVMQRIFHLISENERKERLLGDARREITNLTNEVSQLRAENTMLRLGKRPDDFEPDL